MQRSSGQSKRFMDDRTCFMRTKGDDAHPSKRLKNNATTDVIAKVSDPMKAWLIEDHQAEQRRWNREMRDQAVFYENHIKRLEDQVAGLQGSLWEVTLDRNMAQAAALELRDDFEALTTAHDQVRRYAVHLEESYAPRYFDRLGFQQRLNYPSPPMLNGQRSEDWIDYESESLSTEEEYLE